MGVGQGASVPGDMNLIAGCALDFSVTLRGGLSLDGDEGGELGVRGCAKMPRCAGAQRVYERVSQEYVQVCRCGAQARRCGAQACRCGAQVCRCGAQAFR